MASHGKQIPIGAIGKPLAFTTATGKLAECATLQ
jgi:hypothetical protein